MTTAEIKEAFRNGHSPWEILAILVNAGREYPDAEWRVVDALKLDDEETAEMRDAYDNNV